LSDFVEFHFRFPLKKTDNFARRTGTSPVKPERAQKRSKREILARESAYYTSYWIKMLGGKLVYQYTKKRASGPKCPVTGKRIQGVSFTFFVYGVYFFYSKLLDMTPKFCQNLASYNHFPYRTQVLFVTK